MMDLEQIKAAALAAGAEEWQQGRLLMTRGVRAMRADEQTECAERERCSIFAGFSAVDEGVSRRFVANFRRPEPAAFAAVANPAVVLELVRQLESAEALLRDIAQHPDKPLAGTEFEERYALAGSRGTKVAEC